jgi:hypothetical protein
VLGHSEKGSEQQSGKVKQGEKAQFSLQRGK